MKTIRRNAHRKIATIALTIVKVRMYDQVRGGTVDLTEGTTAASVVTSAFAYLADASYGAKLYDNEDGSYTLHVHSNLYFYLYTQAYLDAVAADKAAREKKQAVQRQQWQNAANALDELPATEPAPITATPIICEYGNDHQVETCLGCGTEDEYGNQIEETPAKTRKKIEALDNELRRDDLNGGLRAAFATERAKLVAPAVTMTRTRMAIGDQISQACTALGIKLGHGWNNGTATFLVDGRDYTAGELADLVLEGGFGANYGGNEVRVNWDSSLVPPKNTEQRMGRALMILRDTQDRISASRARDLDDVAQMLLDLLHERAKEDAPVEKIDFPSGAAEPDKSVMTVQCVRTGRVWRRDGNFWADRWDGRCTWYHMNIVDPMSQGFRIHREGA